jgi:hypothetical protein
MDDSAILRWGLRRAKDMEAWDSRIAVVAEYPIFRNMKHELRIMSMVHLRLGVRPA